MERERGSGCREDGKDAGRGRGWGVLHELGCVGECQGCRGTSWGA